MIKKILIANRGEIALRVIRTAKKMGIKTVAVYSEADTNAMHVAQADEAVFIGPSPADKSYLKIDNIMDAVRRSGADAVHPGYGFLSENGKFARALKKEGVTFIGPDVLAIDKMGDKIEAKKLAEKAKVNTIPGYMGVIQDEKEALKIAQKIGFPIMIKAAAGGGGKGMRIVREKEELKQAIKSAMNEARNSFSDDRIFIEKFIENPRHIEIQIIADGHGNVVCLGERECSIQRHHQKVIEEAPSPFLDDKTRKKMYEQSIALAKKVHYKSAGTMEFIMDPKKNFYFLEMNTRLQVEHPVTEYITGTDLVELMIRIASGEKLPFKQEDVEIKGWAMESRIYAEDPKRGFLPSSGRISEYKEPKKSTNVRVDSGVYAGGEVSMFYDPMIAKLITYGADRTEAIKTMQQSLGEFVIGGISHNISFLEAVMANPRFAAGNLSTNFIAEEYPGGFTGALVTEETTKVFIGVAVFIYLRDAHRAAGTTGQVPGRQRQIGTRWVVTIDDHSYSIYIRDRKDGYEIRHENYHFTIASNWILGNRLFQGVLDGKPVSARIELVPGGFQLTHAGSTVGVTVRSPRSAELGRFMPKPKEEPETPGIVAPISGLVVEVKVKDGDKIKEGQDVVILEAMKMENVLSAQKDTEVKKVHFKAGDSVQAGQMLIEFKN
ncbi:MAG: acetyl-CoA carboxylase biotin carboxylase subunit [Proteobacteria bacterium]|nr:acetyl-CoA carboxylase biotin carboxylase subunit [Pseudomonadota bacterium]